ncbi:MAG TPA: hypothetical protein VHE35_20025 [Kofleriaceae bacterium]|nr:hypothetical protein [Kofleriaceae bacterium]
MSRAVVAAALLALASGCQTFIGVDDVNAHLPRLDGTYLMAIHRIRAQGGFDDVIRTRTLASLDTEARTLDLSFVILGFNTDDAVAEGSITGIEFPADGASTVFPFNLQIPSSAVAAPAPAGADAVIDAQMLLKAEANYSFCARPADAGQATPTFGTVLVAPGAALPVANVDVDCDE